MGKYITETRTVTTSKTVGVVESGEGHPDCKPAPAPPAEPPCTNTDTDGELLKVLLLLQIIIRRIDRATLDQQRIERRINRQGRKIDEVLRIVRNLENPPIPPHIPTRIVVRYYAPQQES